MHSLEGDSEPRLAPLSLALSIHQVSSGFNFSLSLMLLLLLLSACCCRFSLSIRRTCVQQFTACFAMYICEYK